MKDFLSEQSVGNRFLLFCLFIRQNVTRKSFVLQKVYKPRASTGKNNGAVRNLRLLQPVINRKLHDKQIIKNVYQDNLKSKMFFPYIPKDICSYAECSRKKSKSHFHIIAASKCN